MSVAERDGERVAGGVGVGVAERDDVGVGVVVRDEPKEGVTEPEVVGLFEMLLVVEEVREGVRVLDDVRLTVLVVDPVPVRVRVSPGVAVGLGECEPVGVLERVGEGEVVGEMVGEDVLVELAVMGKAEKLP